MCKGYRLLFRLIPVNGCRSLLLRLHLQRCPRCREEWLAEESDGLASPAWIEQEPSLWPQVAALALTGREPQPAAPKRVWAWTAAAAALFCMALGAWLFLAGPNDRIPVTPAKPVSQASFALLSAKIDGQAARAYVFTAGDRQMVAVWIEKNEL